MDGLTAGIQGLGVAPIRWQDFPIAPGVQALFAEADADGDSQVGRGDAKQFFVRTGVPGALLAKVRAAEFHGPQALSLCLHTQFCRTPLLTHVARSATRHTQIWSRCHFSPGEGLTLPEFAMALRSVRPGARTQSPFCSSHSATPPLTDCAH